MPEQGFDGIWPEDVEYLVDEVRKGSPLNKRPILILSKETDSRGRTVAEG